MRLVAWLRSLGKGLAGHDNFARRRNDITPRPLCGAFQEELMDTLQIQDAFAPYYADQPNVIESEPSRLPANKRDLGEMRERLEICRARLARAVAADRKELSSAFAG
jgi:hypothetical protein